MAEPPQPKQDVPPATAEPASSDPPISAVHDDSDPDFDDLDDVLDQFSANAPAKPQPSQSQPTPSASGPGRPVATAETSAIAPPLPQGPKENESEEDFIARLSAEMSTMLSSLSSDPSASVQSPEDIAKMGKELEEFTYKMEKEGIKPEDLLKAILGEEEGTKIADVANNERERRESEHDQRNITKSATDNHEPSTSSKPPPSTSFEDTIRRTMSRLNESDTQATTATQQSSSKSEEDMLAEMLKALDSQSGGGAPDDESGLSKMFLEMMQQLTHKSMLYEPMKELHSQYPEWLEQNKPPKLKLADWERYQRQSVIVKELVTKFEEPGFQDEDPGCKEYIWEKMQAMQGEGAPPEELVKNPFPGMDFGSVPGLGGGEGEGLEEGCPTQ